MRIDEQHGALLIPRFVMPGEMNLTDMFEGKAIKIGVRIEIMILCRDENIVDVEQKAAAGCPGDFPQKIRLGNIRSIKLDVSGGILDEQAAAADHCHHRRRLNVGVLRRLAGARHPAQLAGALVEGEGAVARDPLVAPARVDEAEDQPVLVHQRRVGAAADAGDQPDLLGQGVPPYGLAVAIEADQQAAHSQRIDVAGLGIGGQFALGVLLGAVWSPCSGPTLGAAIGLAAQSETAGWAAVVMAAFSLGATTPILALAYGSQ